jgi:hypothetical protein
MTLGDLSEEDVEKLDEADDARIERDTKGGPQTIRIKYAEIAVHSGSRVSFGATKISVPNDSGEKESDDN